MADTMTDQPATDTPPLQRLLDAYLAQHLARPLRRAWLAAILKKVIAVDAMRACLDSLKGLSDFEAVAALIAYTGLSIRYEHTERIPPRGRVLVVANHPLGTADVLLMLQCVHHVRNDVRVVINKWGPQILPHIARLCLPVDRYSTFDPEARSRIRDALQQEQAVILFPAGGISKLTVRGIRDHPWKHGAVHFARDCQVDILPVHIVGRSSRLFLSLPRKLRHFFVARDMLYPVRQCITVHVGPVIPHARFGTGEVQALTQWLQHTVDALAKTPASLH
jgi:1-acyl-sn-glycerol-3-phosphate acyltransferase